MPCCPPGEPGIGEGFMYDGLVSKPSIAPRSLVLISDQIDPEVLPCPPREPWL